MNKSVTLTIQYFIKNPFGGLEVVSSEGVLTKNDYKKKLENIAKQQDIMTISFHDKDKNFISYHCYLGGVNKIVNGESREFMQDHFFSLIKDIEDIMQEE